MAYEMESAGVVIDDKAFEQAKEDGLAAFAPTYARYGAGYLAAVVISWLPLLGYVFILFRDWLVGSGGTQLLPLAERREVAFMVFGENIAAYSSGIWFWSILLGFVGVLFAYLRAEMHRRHRYIGLAVGDRVIPMGYHQILTVAVACLAVAALMGMGLLAGTIYYFALPLAFLAGMVVNRLFRRLHNLFIKLIFRPNHAVKTRIGLRVLIPRFFGIREAFIADIDVGADRSVLIRGRFRSNAVEAEVRRVVSHYLRGYEPVRIVQDV